MNWFAVKSTYRVDVIDKERTAIDSMLEERVIVFRCRDLDAALERAADDSKAYASGEVYFNEEGHGVLRRSLESVVGYEMIGDPGDGSEVFSQTRLIAATTSDEEAVDLLLGREESGMERARRFGFLRRDLAKDLRNNES